jgi:hypothetical protein
VRRAYVCAVLTLKPKPNSDLGPSCQKQPPSVRFKRCGQDPGHGNCICGGVVQDCRLASWPADGSVRSVESQPLH